MPGFDCSPAIKAHEGCAPTDYQEQAPQSLCWLSDSAYHKLSIQFSGTVISCKTWGSWCKIRLCFFRFYATSFFSATVAALKPSSSKQEQGLRAKSLLGNSESIPFSTEARKQTSWSLTQHYRSFRSTISQGAVWLFLLLDCKLMVLTDLFYVLPSDLLALWTLGQLVITQRLTEAIHLLLMEARVIQFISKNEAKQERKKIKKNRWSDEYATANNSALF